MSDSFATTSRAQDCPLGVDRFVIRPAGPALAGVRTAPAFLLGATAVKAARRQATRFGGVVRSDLLPTPMTILVTPAAVATGHSYDARHGSRGRPGGHPV